jgi:hypothetical protein
MLGYVPAIIWTLIFVFLTAALCYQTLNRNRSVALNLLPLIAEYKQLMQQVVDNHPGLVPYYEQLIAVNFGKKSVLISLDEQAASIMMSDTERSNWLKFRDAVNDYQRARGQFHNLMNHQPMKMIAQLFKMNRLP